MTKINLFTSGLNKNPKRFSKIAHMQGLHLATTQGAFENFLCKACALHQINIVILQTVFGVHTILHSSTLLVMLLMWFAALQSSKAFTCLQGLHVYNLTSSLVSYRTSISQEVYIWCFASLFLTTCKYCEPCNLASLATLHLLDTLGCFFSLVFCKPCTLKALLVFFCFFGRGS